MSIRSKSAKIQMKPRGGSALSIKSTLSLKNHPSIIKDVSKYGKPYQELNHCSYDNYLKCNFLVIFPKKTLPVTSITPHKYYKSITYAASLYILLKYICSFETIMSGPHF